MYKMIIKTEENDVSRERIILRYCKLCRNAEKGLTNIKKIIIIDNNGEIMREYGTN